MKNCKKEAIILKIIRMDDVPPKQDSCGELRELFSSKNIGIAHTIVSGTTQKHMHKRTEEVYYVIKGAGIMVLGDEEAIIREGDTIPILKNTWHCLKTINGKPFELLAVTHPKFDQTDMIFD